MFLIMKLIRPGGPLITDLYHLTNIKIGEVIKASRVIEPYSYPFWKGKFDRGDYRKILKKFGVNFDLIWSIMKSNRFIVCFDEPSPKGWIYSGLMSYLINHVQNKNPISEWTDGPIYSFHIEADINRVFVRDHWYTSPKYYKKRYGKDYWEMFLKSPEKNIHIREIAEGVAKYFKSTIRYSSYHKGKYIAPEFWYSGSYPLKPWEGVEILSGWKVRLLRS